MSVECFQYGSADVAAVPNILFVVPVDLDPANHKNVAIFLGSGSASFPEANMYIRKLRFHFGHSCASIEQSNSDSARLILTNNFLLLTPFNKLLKRYTYLVLV